jgi:hypothetical protein
MKRHESGRRGRPRRRVRVGVTNAWNVSILTGGAGRGRTTHIGVVILAENVKDPGVKGGLDVVELVDIGVLHPVDNHFTANDHDEW